MATIQSYTNTFKVPFVTFSMAQNTSSNTSFQIYMRPIYVNALVAVISHYGWDKVYYIYDSDEGNDKFSYLIFLIYFFVKLEDTLCSK